MSSAVFTNTFHNSQKLLYNMEYGPKESILELMGDKERKLMTANDTKELKMVS